MRVSDRVSLALAGLLLASPVLAAPADWALEPAGLPVGNAQLDLGGAASGAVFSGRGGQNSGQNISGVLKLMPRLHRDYDSGLSIGLNATVMASDPLSRGRYDGDALEKLYGEMRTGLGRVEIGQTDGAGYVLAVAGPKVDAQVSLDDSQTSFFRDPATGRAFTEFFALRTPVGASSNYAKLAYVSPELFGAQVAFSFTPSEAKLVVPFLGAGPQVAGRQAAIWEAALRYADMVGPVQVRVSAALAQGRGERKLAGQEGVSDWGFGLRADYPVQDDLLLSVGGAWRQSNAHAFDINQSRQGGTTHALQASMAATYKAWIVGVEYGDGGADAVGALPRLSQTGYQASLGYVLNSSMQITGGWQWRSYTRGAGLFYNASPRIGLDAGFLHLSLHT